MKIRLIILSLFFISATQAQQLVIDNQGHAGIVQDLAFLNGGKNLLSVSDDKTVRIWDVTSGGLQKTYRFEQEIGPNGKIYAAALSTNERFLFLGGFFGNAGEESTTIGEIRILDLQEEKLLAPLVAHENIITDLVCSEDGKWLISSSADKTIRVWKISGLIQGISPTATAVIDGFDNHLNAITINSAGTIIAAGDEKGYVHTWVVNNMDSAIPSKSLVHSDEVRAVKFDLTGTYLYSAGDDGKIIKWTTNGKFVGVMAELPGRVNVLEMTADGESMVAMGRVGIIYDLSSEMAVSQFGYHTNAVSAISAAPFGKFDGTTGNYMASAGGDDKNILVWNTNTGDVVRNFVGKGKSVFGIGINEESGSIAFGQDNPEGSLDQITLDKSFDLKELLLGFSVENTSDYHRNTKSNGSQFLSKEGANAIGFGGKILSTDPEQDGTVRSYSFVNEGQGIVIGSTYSLNKYNTNGDKLGTFKGHQGEIWAMADYQQQDLLITGSSDQTIKIWNNITGENLATLFVSSDNEWVIWSPQGFYEASAGGEKYIGWHINKGRDNLAEYHDVAAFSNYFHRRDVIEQLLQLKSYNEVAVNLNISAYSAEKIIPPSIAWLSPYATSSQVTGNEVVIKFAITSTTPVTQVKIMGNGRPILIEDDLSISGGGETEEVEFTLTVPEGSNKAYQVSLLAKDSDSKVTSTERSIYFGAVTQETTEENTSVQASTAPITTPMKEATSRNRLTLDPVEEQNQTPSNLYMVSIGVSDYENPQYNLNFAEADAVAMAETFEKQEGKMFNKVTSIMLVNENATREKILNVFQKLEKYTSADDMVIIFIASHGMNVDNQFYIVPYDGKVENPRYSCIDWRDFSDMVGNMSAKVVLFIDTCYSGQLGNNVGQKAQSNTEAIRTLSGKEYGVVIMSAATGYEYSLEHPDWGHGAFTLSILEGINEGKADVKGDGTIYLRELDYYLSERVQELTGGRQHPTTQKPSSISRLSIAKTN